MKRVLGLVVVFCLLLGVFPSVWAEEVTQSNADVVMKVGEKYTLEAVIKYMTELQIPKSVIVKWETSNAKVATVTSGIVKGVNQGGVIITATAVNEGKAYQAQAKVYVVSTVTGVSLNKINLEMKVGQSERLLEKVWPDTAFLKTVTWKSDNIKVATVSNGTVKGVGVGTANITVTTSDGGHTEKCSVRVVSTVTGVKLMEHSITKKVGEIFNLDYTVMPESAFSKDVKWTSSNTKIVSITQGKLKAVSQGMATVTVETVDGKLTDVCTVNVMSTVSGVSLNKDSINITKGDKEVVAAIIAPSDAYEKGVTWKSENTKIATVKDGVITGVELGSTIVTATTIDGGYVAQVAVHVVTYGIALQAIDLLDSEVTMNVGENRWFIYKAVPENAVIPKLKVTHTAFGGTKTYPIQIKDNMVYVTAIAEGDYQVNLFVETNPSISDSCVLHIKSMVTGIEISHSSLSLAVGESVQLQGKALPDTAIVKGVIWKSSNPRIAKINSVTGEITGVAEGECIVTAATIDGGLERSLTVTVRNPVDIESLKLRDEQGNIIGEKPVPQDETDDQTPGGEPDSSEQQPISIVIDGVPVVTDQPPVLHNDRVLAPMRAIFEALGMTVFWNETLQTATGVIADNMIQLTIDQPKAVVNGDEHTLDVPPMLVSGRTMVPVRFIAESLGVKVDWDEATRTVVIKTK